MGIHCLYGLFLDQRLNHITIMTKVLVATEKAFAKVAVDGIRKIVEGAGFELALLENYTEAADLLKAVADADALIVRSDKVTAQVLEAAKKLKIVVRAGAGYDNLDLEACTKHGVVAMNTPGQNSNAVAELVVGFMVFMARLKFSGKSGSEIRGKSLGIHGYGNIGRIIARDAIALGMKVYACDPYVKKAEEGVELLASLDELYSKSQYVTLHIPATAETKLSVTHALVSRMPKGACLINTARKEVIDEDGLLKLMAEREDLRYVADVAPDKLDEFNKFGDRVFFTPKKMGAQTSEANINAGLAAAEQIVKFIKNGDKTFQLNK